MKAGVGCGSSWRYRGVAPLDRRIGVVGRRHGGVQLHFLPQSGEAGLARQRDRSI